jgi:putative FmdB family regulatory protein
MGLYNYFCDECGYEFDIKTNNMKPPKIPICPSCKSNKVIREWNVPNIIFHGNGFYKTDSKKGGSGDV